MADAKFCRMCQRMLQDYQQVYCSTACQALAIRKLEDDPELSMDSRCRRAWMRPDVLNGLPMAAQLFLAERAQQQRPSYEAWKAGTALRCRCPRPDAYQGYQRSDFDDDMAKCLTWSLRVTRDEYYQRAAAR